uniref:Genome polyprotein n=1 Tax=Rousettus madagascariensis sapelovirus TaxID=3044257 RepID=A0AA49FPW8_9PICO|nr:MAG: polyprotein [Rousettus madagascariensis sapelovirus]
MVFFFNSKDNKQVNFPRVRRVRHVMSTGPVQVVWEGGFLHVHKFKITWFPGDPKIKWSSEDIVPIPRENTELRYTVYERPLISGKLESDKKVVDIGLFRETDYTDDVMDQCGQVNSAQTGNKPMYAHAGGNLTMINYYGTDHTQAYNPTQQTMDPGQFTKPIADVAGAMAGPALKSPSVEEMGMSDRLMQLVSGATCITTQEAAHAVVAYGCWPRFLDETAEAVDLPTRPGPSCDRFYTLDSVTWTTTSTSWTLPFPGCMADTGIFGQNLIYHYLYRSGFCVHVQANASKFHQGAILVAMVPEFQQQNPLPDSMTVNPAVSEHAYPTAQMTLFPHAIINLRTNNAATIVYPYTSPTPAGYGLTHNFVTLYIKVIAPLAYNAGATTEVPITVSVAPMCSQFSGLRNAVAAQGIPVWQIPGSRQFVTTLRNDGIPIYPNFRQTKAFKNPGRVRNLLEVAEVGTFCTVSNTTGFTLDLAVSKPSVNNATSAAAPIAVWDMSLNSNFLSSTFLARLSWFYTQYRGGVNLSFLFCGSQMATGRLLIAYTPPGGAAPTTRKQAMLGTHIIWDVGLQSTVKFTVPYISASQFRNQNQQNSILAYDGYISVWYQTQIVVPPGAPSTCQIMVLASAASDFCFRIPSDSAFFQGLGDDIKGFIQDAVKTNVESAVTTSAPKNPEGANGGLAITSGDAPALTAAETGTTDTTPGEGQMELRAYNTEFSTEETDLEYMMSRYALFFHKRIGLTTGSGSGSQANYTMFFTIPVNFNSVVNTSTGFKSKWNAFTYWKFDVDFVILVSNVTQNTLGQDATLQVMFCPVGASVPIAIDSTLWDNPTNPSVYFRVSDPPASFRVPFLTPANYYAAWYDGYSNFSKTTNTTYGQFPGNQIGTLAVRYVTDKNASVVTNSLLCKILIRPVNIEAYMPRPLVSFKSNVATSAVTTGRKVFVDNTFVNVGPTFRPESEHWHPHEMFYYQEQATKTELFIRDLYEHYSLPIVGENGPFSCWKYSKNWFVVSEHAMRDWNNACTNGIEYNISSAFAKWYTIPTLRAKVTRYTVDRHRDLCFFQLDGFRFKKGIKNLMYKSYTYNNSDNLLVTNSREFPFHYQTTPPFHHREFLNIGGYKRQLDLLGVDYEAAPGYCGSLLVNLKEHKVVGMVTAMGKTKFADPFGLPRVVTYSTMLTQKSHCRQNPFFLPPYRRDDSCQIGPVEQGLLDTVKNAVGDMGFSFGEGFSEGLEDVVSQITNEINLGVERTKATIKDQMMLTGVKVIVKVIAACVILMNTPDWHRFSSAVALGALVGVDFLTTDPFVWLRKQIWPFNEVEEQGPTEWFKEFNVACTAIKGIEYLCQKIQEFIEWCKRLFKKEKLDEKKRNFLEILKCWPDMMKAWDDMEAKIGSSSDAERTDLANMILKMKQSADLYGVERNFATSQIIKYAARASKYLQNKTNNRSEPVSVLIHGTPGTGKSLATGLIGRALSEQTDKRSPYSLPPDPKHFDGYQQQSVVLMDDLGQNPDGEDMSLFCQMVSTTAFVPPMASLEEKGVPFTSDFVLASTNCLVLTPPTVAEPEAIRRRFYLDLDIVVSPNFLKTNKLDISKCVKCSHDQGIHPKNFKKCNPLVCGEAIRFKDRHTNNTYTMDEIVTVMMNEHKRRTSISDILDGLFQGPGCVDGDDVVRAKQITGKKRKVDRVLPEDVAKILEFHTDEGLINKLEEQGYIMPARVTYAREKVKVLDYVNMTINALAVVGILSTLGLLFYFLIKVFSGQQGPYDGNAKKPLKRPEKRVVEVQGPDNEFISKLYKSSLVPVTTEKGPFTGLGVFDKWMILPKHACPGECITVDGKIVKVLDNVDLESTKGNLELTVVKLDRNENFRDIRKFFPDHSTTVKDAWLALNSENFPRVMVPIGTVSPFGFLNLSCRATYNTLTYPYPTRSGQCGGVVVKAGKIYGLHIGGDGANGYAAALKSSYFANFQGSIVEEKPTKTPINVRTTTSLFPSVFHSVFDGTKEPAALSSKDKRLEVDLEEAMFSKYKGNVDISLPAETLIAIDQYVEQIRPILPPNLTEPLELEEVVYGIQNLEGLDLDTSAGFPYNVNGIKKRDLIPPAGEPLTKLTDALDLHGYQLPYTIYMKDELRPLEKIKKGKTRLIHCSSLNDTIRTKTVFGRLFQAFHQNPGTVTGSAVGCNPDVDWSRFAVELGWDNICAFDYSNWDGSLSPFWFDGLKMLLIKLGYTEGDLKIINHLYDNKQLFKNKELHIVGGMPSGCSGTSIFNSIINNLAIRTIVLQTYKGIDLERLRVLCYGDDILVSYPFPLDPAELALTGKKLGLIMTPADKSDSFQGCCTLAEATFLKRGFKPDEKFPFLIHPTYCMKEAEESLRWTRSASTTQEHVRSICELVWHNGRVPYENFVDKIRTIPVGRALIIPSYDYFLYKWYDEF